MVRDSATPEKGVSGLESPNQASTGLRGDWFPPQVRPNGQEFTGRAQHPRPSDALGLPSRMCRLSSLKGRGRSSQPPPYTVHRVPGARRFQYHTGGATSNRSLGITLSASIFGGRSTR